ncbi:MAG: cupin domain-containing protein [Deltaproteobacteria bacterium]|nr:cupin domain-containing protein [Deltaproteobacteria bacterium]
MGNTKSIVRPLSTVETKPIDGTRGARMAILIGPEQGAPHFVMRRFVLEPGGLIPEHAHEDLEHEQVVVRGELVLTLDGETRTVRAGDTVYMPPGSSHRYENRGSEEAEFICVIPLTEGYETRWLESLD